MRIKVTITQEIISLSLRCKRKSDPIYLAFRKVFPECSVTLGKLVLDFFDMNSEMVDLPENARSMIVSFVDNEEISPISFEVTIHTPFTQEMIEAVNKSSNLEIVE